MNPERNKEVQTRRMTPLGHLEPPSLLSYLPLWGQRYSAVLCFPICNIGVSIQPPGLKFSEADWDLQLGLACSGRQRWISLTPWMSFPHIGRSFFRFSFLNGKLGRELIHDKEDPPRGSQQAMGGKGGGLRIWVFGGGEAPGLSKHKMRQDSTGAPGVAASVEGPGRRCGDLEQRFLKHGPGPPASALPENLLIWNFQGEAQTSLFQQVLQVILTHATIKNHGSRAEFRGWAIWSWSLAFILPLPTSSVRPWGRC